MALVTLTDDLHWENDRGNASVLITDFLKPSSNAGRAFKKSSTISSEFPFVLKSKSLTFSLWRYKGGTFLLLPLQGKR